MLTPTFNYQSPIFPPFPQGEGSLRPPCTPYTPCLTPTDDSSAQGAPLYHLDVAHSNMNSYDIEKISELFTRGALQPALEGKNGAQFLVVDGRNFAVFKSKEKEMGKLRLQRPGVFDVIKAGIRRGEGPFGDFLASLVMQDYLQQAGISSEEISVPRSMWATVMDRSRFDQEGCFHEFMDNCISLAKIAIEFQNKTSPEYKTAQKYLTQISTEAIQMTVVMMLLLVNTDGHEGNILLKNSNGKTTLIPIDSLILPRQGDSSVELPKTGTPLISSALEEPLSDKVKSFILNSLDSRTLEDHLNRCKEQGIEDAKTFGSKERMIPHYIAIQLLKEGVKSGLSLGALSGLFVEFNLISPDKAISCIYRAHRDSMTSIAELCADFINIYDAALTRLKQGQPQPSKLNALYDLALEETNQDLLKKHMPSKERYPIPRTLNF